MPTPRAMTFLVTALIFYAFGNQTQIGWLYVISALMAGVVAVSFVINRWALRGIIAARHIGDSALDAEWYEGDDMTIRVEVQRRRPTYQVQMRETCPFAPPDQAEHRLFIPVVPSGNPVALTYNVLADRRGAFTFAPSPTQTRFPFGFFKRNGTLPLPTPTLIFPEVRSLTRFPLFERHLAAEIAATRAGQGGEVIGVRPYRAGDSPRHIHWRSVARTGQMISKEFADDSRPSLSLHLDRFYPAPNTSKHTAFEWAVKCAVSVADYARQRGYPLRLLSDSDYPAPSGAAAWDSVLQFMARVQPTAHPILSAAVRQGGIGQFVVVIVPHPAVDAADALLDLVGRGVTVMPILLEGSTFPEKGSDAAPLASRLHQRGIESITIHYGEDWTGQIAGTHERRSAYAAIS